MTIDPCRALDVVLADGEPRAARAGRRATSARGAAPGGSLDGRDPPRPARHRRAHARRDARLPALLAPGRRLPARPHRRRRRRRSTWRSSSSARRARSRSVVEAEVALVPVRRAPRHGGRALRVDRRGDRRDRRRDGAGRRRRSSCSTASSSTCRAASSSSARSATSSRATPTRSCSSSSRATTEDEVIAPARRARGGVGRARPRLPHAARGRARRAGRRARGPQGRPRAADGREPRLAPAARVHRGHRRPARAARPTTSPSFKAILDAPRPHGRLLRPLLRRLPAHPPVRRPARGRAGSAHARASPTRSPSSSLEYGGVNASEHGDGLVRSEFNRRMFGDELYEAMREVKALFDPRRPAEPGQDRRRRGHDRAPARPGAADRAAARDAAATSRRRGHARRGRPLHEHRRCAARRDRASCARRTWPRATRSTPPAAARTRSSRAVGARPAGGARRRAPARDPRPVPRVQGLQARVPARRRHGDAQDRVPVALPATATACRCARGLFGGDPALNPLGVGARAAVQPARALAAARALLERTLGHRARAARCPASSATRCCAGSRAGRAPATPAPRGDGRLPRRLVHDVHRAGDRPRGDRAARARRVAGAPAERGLLRPGEHLEGPARPGRRMARAMVGAPRAERGAACRSSASSRRACSTLRDEYVALLPGRPARRGRGRPRTARRGPARRGDRRRRPRLRSDSPLAGRADPLPRPLPPEGRRRHGGDASRCCGASPAPRSTRSTPAAAAWRARSGSRPSTTTCRCRSAGCGSSRRSRRAGGRAGRRDRRLVPAADRPRRRAARRATRSSSCRGGRARRGAVRGRARSSRRSRPARTPSSGGCPARPPPARGARRGRPPALAAARRAVGDGADGSDLLFCHWPVTAEALAPHVPASLPLDTYDGSAWLSVTPFEVSGTRPRGTLPPPGLSRFPELNVRTYVTLGGRPGIWFLSLDAASMLAVAVARGLYRLPYLRARMAIERDRPWIHYRSERRDPRGAPARFEARYRPTGGVRHAAARVARGVARRALPPVHRRRPRPRVRRRHPPPPVDPAGRHGRHP